LFVIPNSRIHTDPDHPEEPSILSLKTGNKEWFMNDERHRVGGPAIIMTNYGSIMEYWLNGVQYKLEAYVKHPLMVEYKINAVLELKE
jgi:hypothetical protein